MQRQVQDSILFLAALSRMTPCGGRDGGLAASREVVAKMGDDKTIGNRRLNLHAGMWAGTQTALTTAISLCELPKINSVFLRS